MGLKRCLVVDQMHESLMPMLTAEGWEVDYHPQATRTEIRRMHQGFDGLIVRSKTFVDRDLLGDAPTIRFVGRAGAGIDNLDLEFLKSKGIHVIHAAEGNRDAVGEFTIGVLVTLLRNIARSHREVTQSLWLREENRGSEIMGKTVSIIGFGNMGRAFAQRLTGFGCNILVYDKYKRGFSNDYWFESDMERIYEETDILSLHIPLTNETRLMVNSSYLNRFRKNIIFINTARGEIVPLADLAAALASGKVRGAALDVLENENLQSFSDAQKEVFQKLVTSGNVIFTPHIAGWTYESHLKINVALVDKIKRLALS